MSKGYLNFLVVTYNSIAHQLLSSATKHLDHT